MRSAPCGSTWYIARKIIACKVEDLPDIISKAHHTYPCTASMTQDPELNDTILHRAGYIILEAVYEGIRDAEAAKILLKELRERGVSFSED